MPRPRTPTSPTMRPSWARFRRPAPSSASRRPRPAAARPESRTRPAGPKRGEIAFFKSTRSMSRRPDGAFACSMLRAVVFTDLLLPASLTDAKEIRFLNARYRRYHEEEGGALFGFTQAEKPAPAEPESADIARAEALVGGQVRAHRRDRPEPRGARGAQGRRSGPQGAPKGAGRIDADPPRDRRGAPIAHPPPVKPGRSAAAEAVWKAREIKAVAKARERRLAALARKTADSSKQCDAHERPSPEDALAHRLPASARTRQR